MSGGAVLLGLGLAGAAFALYLAHRSSSSRRAASLPTVSVPPSTAVSLRKPIACAVPTVQTPAEIEALLRTAWGCVEARPLLDDVDVEHCVWHAHWPALEYPERAVPGDHVSVAEALGSVRASVVAARAGQRAANRDLGDPEPEQPRDEQLEILEGSTSLAEPEPTMPTSKFPVTAQMALIPRSAMAGAEVIRSATANILVDLASRTRGQPTRGSFQTNRRVLDQGFLARTLCRG